MLLKSFDIPVVVMLDSDAQKYADDLNRARESSLTNVEEVVVLKRGTIEDYFPKKIIRELLNTDFNADPKVTADDLPDDLAGEKLLKEISRLMHDRKCGKGLSYFKRVLGLKAVKMMAEQHIDIDEELRAVVRKVAEVATRT